jgi:hypothetical protein
MVRRKQEGNRRETGRKQEGNRKETGRKQEGNRKETGGRPMSLSVFGEKALVPNDDLLAEVLDSSKVLWDRIAGSIRDTCSEVSSEWKFYSKKAGWSLVIKSKTRTLVYMIPQKGFFKVNFVFGEKAVTSAQDIGLPAAVLALISEAKPYVEGRSFMFDVRRPEDADTALNLIEIKKAN